ncbi:arginase family protein [Chitinibacteraceae bacterium HSL-7]
MSIGLTVFQGRAADRNDLAVPAARLLAQLWAERLGIAASVVGVARPSFNADWKTELAAARVGLTELAEHLGAVLAAQMRPLTVLNRCAASIATIPQVVLRHPGVCVVWFDAHADLNTPESTTSGYLGGLALSGPAGLWTSGYGSGLALSDIVLVGARDLDPFEEALVASGQVRRVAVDAVDLAGELVRAVAGRAVYVHFDCDVLEPGVVPTEFRVPGGLSLATVHALSTALAAGEVIGVEVAELQSSGVAADDTASAGAVADALAPLVDALAR